MILAIVVGLLVASVMVFAAPHAPLASVPPPASIPDVRASAASPYIWYNYSDFFNVPFGEWFDYRTNAGYGDEPVGASCFNQTSVNDLVCTTNVGGIPRVLGYPYIDWLGPSGTAAIYAPFRAHITAFSEPGYNLSEPVFLPVLNYAAPAGTTLTFNWKMQYLDKANFTLLTSTRSCYGGTGGNANDGYEAWSRIYLTMDNQEAARLFGAPATGSQTWWNTNTLNGCSGSKTQFGALEKSVDAWFSNMANGKYDIYNGYDGAYSNLFTNVTGTVVSTGTTGTTNVVIENAARGMEALLDRFFYWGNASYVGNTGNSAAAKGWWGMENGWWDDLGYKGTLSSTGMNFDLRGVMQYLFQERALPGPDTTFRSSTNLGDADDIPVWTWGPMLLDYGVFSPQHLSEITRYTGTNYIKTTPGSTDYGTNTTFDYTPVSWVAQAGEYWNYVFPTASGPFFPNPATATITTTPPGMQFPTITSSLSFLKVFPSTYGTWTAGTGTWSVTGGTAESWPNGSPGHYPYLPYPGIYFEPAALPPTVTTSNPSSVANTGATLNGNLANLGGATSVTVGFLYGTDPTLATNTNTTPQTKTATGAFTQAVTGLTPATQYYVQAWANGEGFAKGSIVPFTTTGTPPSVTTSTQTAVTVSGATLNGALTNLGTATTVTVGFLYGTSPTLTGAANTTPISETATTTFSVPVTGLASGTLYYFRAWALGDGFATGGILSFTTGTSASAPTVTTNQASAITTTGVTLNGDLTGLGTASTVNVGFRWGTDPSMVAFSNTTGTAETAVTTFSTTLGSLSPGTRYYYQAWANGNGFTLGVTVTFTTSSTPPTVSTSAATTVTTNGAILNGDLTALGTATSVDVGFRYGTDPTLAVNTNTTPVAETAVTTFSATVSGLTPGTTYYVQAWANGQGFATGSIVSFKTSVTPPLVRTDPATTITSSSAVLNGATTSIGTATSVSVGFWYGTDPVLGTYTNVSAGTQTVPGGFTAAVSGLTASTAYYVEAWANGHGFVTGSIVTFTTQAAAVTPPTVATSAASAIAQTGATLNGATSSLGTASSVTVGFLWGTSSTLASATNVSLSTPQTTAGAFTSALTGLTAGTTYYFQAWANGDGFAAGTIENFATTAASVTPPTVTTGAVSGLSSSGATLNGNLGALGSASSVTVGFLWGTDAALTGATNVSLSTPQTATGAFTSALTGLAPGTTYYFEAWGNGAGFAHGSIQSFTTPGSTPPPESSSLLIYAAVAVVIIAVVAVVALLMMRRRKQSPPSPPPSP